MNYSALPYLFAIAVLIAVFRSVRARNLDSLSKYWLTGWVFILVHFSAQFLLSGGGVREMLAHSVSLIMLMSAGCAFVAASYSSSMSAQRQIFYCVLINGCNVACLVSYAWHVPGITTYLYLSIGGLFLGLIGLYATHQYARIPTGIFVLFLVLRLAQIVILYACPLQWLTYWILADIYLAAGLLLLERYLEQKPTDKNDMGMKVVICSFFAWAGLYLLQPFIIQYAVGTQLDIELRNLPKFLVAVGMILALLEDQVHHHEHLALHDELTGLPNRRLFEDRLQQGIDRAHRTGKHVALLTIDLNHFKHVNDVFGHPAGDYFLKTATARFLQIIRRADTIARTGGDEFCSVICDLPNREATRIVIQALQHSIQEPVMIQGKAVPISASIGMALYPEDGTTIEMLIAAADADMYQIKTLMHGAKSNRRPPERDKPMSTPQVHAGS